VIAALAFALRLLRGNLPRSLWVSLGILLTVWVAGGLVVDDLRGPDSARYMYFGAVGVILVASAAATRVRFTRFGLAILFGVAAIGLATNVALLRERSAAMREASARIMAPSIGRLASLGSRGARSSLRWRRSSGPSAVAKRRLIDGLQAMNTPSTMLPNVDSMSSTARAVAPPVTAVTR
jgi:hypothetical protein